MSTVAVFDSSYDSGDAVFDASYEPSDNPIVVDWDIPMGNVSAASINITNPNSSTPTIYTDWRTTSGHGFGWRHFAYKISNAAGRTPTFQVLNSNRDGLISSANYKPVYTQDYVNWVQASTMTTGGTPNVLQFSFANPLPAGDIFIHSSPTGRQAEADSLTTELLTTYSSVASPTISADVNGVIHTMASRLDDAGRQCGLSNIYGVKLAFGGSTTDGARKRNVILTAGMHAAGEAQSWQVFERGVRWLLDSAHAAAVNLRANCDFYLYYNINPAGITGGHARFDFDSGNPGINWYPGLDGPNPEVAAIQAAQLADMTERDVLMDYHGDVYSLKDYILYIPTSQNDVGTREAQYQAFIDEGTTIFGEAPELGYSGAVANTITGWAEDHLNVRAMITVEVAARSHTTTAHYEGLSTKWLRTLEAVDQQGLLVEAPVITKGIRLTLHDGQTPIGAMSDVQVAFFDQPEPKDFSSPTFTAGNGSITAQGEIEIDIDQSTALDVGQFGSVLIYKLDTNDHRNSHVFFSRVEVVDISE